MRHRLAICVLSIAFQLASGVLEGGQNRSPAPRLSVWVNHLGKDPVGLSLTARLRERFANSPLFSLVGIQEDADVEVRLISDDPVGVYPPGKFSCADEIRGATSVASVTIVWLAEHPILLDTQMFQVGRASSARIADDLFALTDRATAKARLP